MGDTGRFMSIPVSQAAVADMLIYLENAKAQHISVTAWDIA